MKTFALKVQRFLKSEDGPTAVEYAVMLALIVIVCIALVIRLLADPANPVHKFLAYMANLG